MSDSKRCPICELPAQIDFLGAWFIRCSSCGDYAISVAGPEHLAGLVPSDRSKLRCVMTERRLKGLTGLFITASKHEAPADGRTLVTIPELLSDFPKAPTDLFDHALQNLARIIQHPAHQVSLGPSLEAALFAPGNFYGMVEQLTGIGYLAERKGAVGHYFITPQGWARVQTLQTQRMESRQAFVAMWFDETRRSFFDIGLQPAIETDKRFVALRIDRKEHNERIDDLIIAEIRRSRFLVADFTGNRPGVYFEAGLALGLGLPVIWCVEEGGTKDLHFDTRQFNHIVYTTAQDLKEKLLNRIRATIP